MSSAISDLPNQKPPTSVSPEKDSSQGTSGKVNEKKPLAIKTWGDLNNIISGKTFVASNQTKKRSEKKLLTVDTNVN